MKAYSYVRFSSSQQAKGTSLERQTKAATEYAKRRGWELDTQTTFHDLGVSAFRGGHEDGAFGQFLSAVEQGLITTPCALLVESLDRLGRDELGKAQARFQALLAAGMTVVTLADNQEYTPESCNDLGRIMISLVTMYRAHEESQIKAVRSKAAWNNCRATGNLKRRGGITPGWLKKTEDRTGFVVIEERAAIVHRIFDMAVQGYGSVRIVKTLNDEGIPSFTGGQWSSGCVSKMLTRRTVLGEWQPREQYYVDGKKRFRDVGEPQQIYPPVIDPATWAKVQDARRSRGKGPILRRGSFGKSIFSGLLFCPCGGPIRFTQYKKDPKRHEAYLHCRRHSEYGHTCEHQKGYLNYHKVVGALLVGMLHLDWASVFPELQGAATKARQALEDRCTELRLHCADLEKRQGRLLDAIETGESLPVLLGRLKKAEAELTTAKAELAESQERLAMMTKDTADAAETAEAFAKLPDLLKQEDGPLLVNTFLRSRFERITLDWESETLVCHWADGATSTGISLDADQLAEGFGGVPLAAGWS